MYTEVGQRKEEGKVKLVGVQREVRGGKRIFDSCLGKGVRAVVRRGERTCAYVSGHGEKVGDIRTEHVGNKKKKKSNGTGKGGIR